MEETGVAGYSVSSSGGVLEICAVSYGTNTHAGLGESKVFSAVQAWRFALAPNEVWNTYLIASCFLHSFDKTIVAHASR